MLLFTTMKRLIRLGLLLVFVSCSSIGYVPNMDNVSDIYICQTRTSSGNTFASLYNQLTKIDSLDLYHLNKCEMNIVVEAIKKATRTTFRYGKYGEGLICCKIKRYDDESMDNIVICRGEKCIHIHNLDNKSEYSIRIQSEESKRLITFLRTFYHDDKLFAY